ncbi:H+/Cl- antiporter ClcA [Granulicella aggregans]|uniref:H+/Cl- antiporter ClcA n=1 Tax=Granulicella aggregans TaxID=474949 RepID=A0A7W8E2A9_9BACT|nr:chloride channel protein [Granulicella aggregans]MBB5056161.1 H+/Cl- antiporter ClcA [Granulicella aggregans]
MKSEASILRDFTVDRRVWLLSGVSIGIGICATLLAVVLLRCISLSTNLFYYHRFSIAPVSSAGSSLGYWMVLIPVLGGLLVGLMARFGSDKIRGHGIPEAIEAILLHRAKVDPKIALLKPLSAAIAIGSGGPFGAEGPIIMTGGAVGSLIGQWMHVTDAERTTLLVAGAAAGMSATFATPVAAILLAVELLLFEWRPRSLVPVALASATAGLLRVYWLGAGPLFNMPAFDAPPRGSLVLGALVLGAILALVASAMSRMMYAFEDLFERLPIHWMWWPAIGGVGIGVGGLFFPRGLGVGYDNIADLLRGNAPLGLIGGILLAKSLMWAFSLGSGTSGGVLAPLLMIGGAVGALAGHLIHAPVESQALWALIGMGSMLAGSLGVPLTAILFCLEVTHCLPALLPLTVACIASYLVTSLIMPRSILTEKLSRRGYHLTREYGVDPLELVLVRDVVSAPAQGVSTHQLPDFYAYADETTRSAAETMASEGLETLTVVDRETRLICGELSLRDLLRGRGRSYERESERLKLSRSLSPEHGGHN